jgi:queuine tRNA-ribosyltransferase
VKANEMLGAILLSAINIAYYQELMRGIREAIEAGGFEDFRAKTREGWERGQS